MNTLEPMVQFYKTHKWGQGIHVDKSRYCLVEARTEIGNYSGEKLSHELRNRCHGRVVQWNDEPGRTFEEVMEMLKLHDSA